MSEYNYVKAKALQKKAERLIRYHRSNVFLSDRHEKALIKILDMMHPLYEDRKNHYMKTLLFTVHNQGEMQKHGFKNWHDLIKD